MKQQLLISVQSTAKSSRSEANLKLREFKAVHGIKTYRSPNLRREDLPWIALMAYPEDLLKDIGTIMAESFCLYKESDRLRYGTSELVAIRNLCEQMKIKGP
jgi:hypothetical protein